MVFSTDCCLDLVTLGQGAEDNPLIAVGVHTKDTVCDRCPRMPTTSWAERAYSSRALDPSLGQASAFPSLLQLRMRIEVPVWRDLATARNPTADLPAEEDSASDDTGSAEQSPRLALPVPVGMAETQADEATEDEAMNDEPSCAFAKGYGRFGIGYTRPATALGNFEQGDIGAESAVVAQWLTSGLRIAMFRTGWNLISTRYSLTKVPSPVLSGYYSKGYPLTPKMADRPYNQYGTTHCSEEKWNQLCRWLTGNPTFRLQLVSHKQALRDHMGYSQETADPSNKARRTDPLRKREVPQLQQGLPGTASLPLRLRPQGGPTGGGSSVVLIGRLPTQQQPLGRATSAMRWVTLVTFSIGA